MGNNAGENDTIITKTVSTSSTVANSKVTEHSFMPGTETVFFNIHKVYPEARHLNFGLCTTADLETILEPNTLASSVKAIVDIQWAMNGEADLSHIAATLLSMRGR